MQARYRHFECLAHCLAWLVKGVAHIGNKISTSLRKIGVSYRGAQNGAQNIVKKDPGRARQSSKKLHQTWRTLYSESLYMYIHLQQLLILITI